MDGPLLHSLSKRLSVCTVLHSLNILLSSDVIGDYIFIHHVVMTPATLSTSRCKCININTWWNIMAGFMSTSIVPSVVRVNFVRHHHPPSRSPLTITIVVRRFKLWPSLHLQHWAFTAPNSLLITSKVDLVLLPLLLIFSRRIKNKISSHQPCCTKLSR